MFARLRSILLKTPVLVALGLVLAYLLFGWFGFEPLVKWAAPKFIADKSQHQLSIGAAQFDPLALSVRVGDLKLAEPDGKPLLSFAELFVDFEAASLFKWAYTFDVVRLTGPKARVVLLADGRLNWTALIEAFKEEEEEPEKPLPRLLIRRIALEKGRVEVADRRVGFETALNPLDLTLTALSTLPEDKGAYTLAATTQVGARIRWKGDVILKPVLATGELAVDSLPLARVWPYLETKLNMAPPQGVAAMGLKYRVGWADKKLSLNLNDLGLSVDKLALSGLKDVSPSVVLERLTLSGGRFDLGRQTLDIGEIALNGGRVDLSRDAAGRLNVQDWFAPPSPGGGGAGGEGERVAPGETVAVREPSPLTPAPSPSVTGENTGRPPGKAKESPAQPWRVNLARFALDGLGVRFRDAGFAAPLTAELGNVKLGFQAAAEAGAGAPQVKVDGFALDLSGIRLLSGAIPAPLFVLGGAALEGGSLDLAARQAQVAKVVLLNGKVEAERDAQGRIALAEAFKPAQDRWAAPVAIANRPSGRSEYAQTLPQGGRVAKPGEGGARKGALQSPPSLAERVPAGGPEPLEGRGACAANSPSCPPTPLPTGEGGQHATPGSIGIPDGGGWKYRLDRLELTGFEIAARDKTLTPAAGLTLQQIQASVEGLSQDLKAALPVKLGFRVKEGGRFEAAGKVVPAKPQADLKLKLADLALSPAQPYLDKFTNLALTSGRASSAGQARYAEGKFRYAGGFRVDDLLLKEVSSGERFLAWKSVATADLAATQAGLDIGELRVDQLGMKMVIFQDKSTSVAKAFQKGPPAPVNEAPKAVKPPPSPWDEEDVAAAPPAPEAKPETKPETKPEAKPAAPAYPVDIERVRITRGEMDFADLSLALPFGTRVHELKGNLNGISNRPGGQAQLEVDGRVDEYGLARAVGQVDLFNPTGFMDIKVVFQNVEMTNLTPYTATFVGRKIDSGKLSLDLEYKLKDRQMLGENQIIMNRLTLGERVESPTAKNLPLDLAIAILEDSNGVIDLELPVSGSLDDPKFSYSRIIWKAIGNIIVKLVTAPFRALGKLFGAGGGEQMENMSFELGDGDLLPPEKEKLKKLAEVLGKRPGLALTVRGSYAPEAERPVLKEMALRRQVAEAMGIKLAAGEEPGPVSTAQPKAQAALEALYAKAFGDEPLKSLLARFTQANPDKQPEKSTAGKLISRLGGLFKEKPKPLSETELAELKGADLHVLIYQRLLDKVEVGDAQLAALGKARGEAIAAAVTGAGVAPERVKVEPPERVAADGRNVQVKLALTTAPRKPAPAAPAQAPVAPAPSPVAAP